jgi:hypothetical protein
MKIRDELHFIRVDWSGQKSTKSTDLRQFKQDWRKNWRNQQLPIDCLEGVIWRQARVNFLNLIVLVLFVTL